MKNFSIAAVAIAVLLPLSLQAKRNTARLQHVPQALSILPNGKIAAALPESPAGPMMPVLKTAAGTIRLISEYHAYGNGASYRNNDSSHYVYSGNRDGYFDRPMLYDSSLKLRWDTATSSWKRQSLIVQSFDAQSRILTSTSLVWDAGTVMFRNSAQQSYAYNASGNQTLMLTQSWNPSTNSWTNLQRFTNFTYNSAGNVLSYTSQSWQIGTSSWLNGFRYTVSYNPSGWLTQMVLAEQWDASNAAWDSVYKETFGYDGSGNNTAYIYQYWDAQASLWKNSNATYYHYNPSGMLVSTLDCRGDGTGLSWLNVDSTSNAALNAAGMPLTQLTFLWASSAWQPSRRITQTYTAAGTLTSTWLRETWNGSTFVNDSRKFSFYDPNNLITTWHTETFASGAWVVTGGDGNHRYHYADATSVPGTQTPRSTLLILPNPASASMKVLMPLVGAQAAELIIVDMSGRQVMHMNLPAGTDRTDIATEHLADGNYLLQLFAGKQRWQEHFAVFH